MISICKILYHKLIILQHHYFRILFQKHYTIFNKNWSNKLMNNNHAWAKFILLAIILISIILRLIKLYEFVIWGSDTGEHYFLLNQMISSGEIQVEYNGWGFAYPYFPGMHLINAGFSNISNISTFNTLIIIVPIIAALSVLIIYCIAQRIFHDIRVSLISAAIIAVVMPHIYTSSHPIPGSLGGFLLLTCIFLLLKSYDNRKFILPLIITSTALVAKILPAR